MEKKFISYELEFINSAIFTTSSLSNLVDNLAKGVHKIKCNNEHDNKARETCGIKYKNCECCFEYTNVIEDSIEYKSLCCNINYQKKFDENIKKRFANTYKSSNHDINKFIFLLRSSVDPYEDMDDWEKFNETSSPEKEEFYSHLYMENIADERNYTRQKEFVKILK